MSVMPCDENLSREQTRHVFFVEYKKIKKKKLAPSSVLREAKIAYYARNMFEAGRFFFFVKAT